MTSDSSCHRLGPIELGVIPIHLGQGHDLDGQRPRARLDRVRTDFKRTRCIQPGVALEEVDTSSRVQEVDALVELNQGSTKWGQRVEPEKPSAGLPQTDKVYPIDLLAFRGFAPASSAELKVDVL